MNLEPCDPEIFESGVILLITETRGAREFELWVEEIRKLTGQRIDWSYFAGRAVVRALGDIELIKATIHDLKYKHVRQVTQGQDRAILWRFGVNI